MLVITKLQHMSLSNFLWVIFDALLFASGDALASKWYSSSSGSNWWLVVAIAMNAVGLFVFGKMVVSNLGLLRGGYSVAISIALLIVAISTLILGERLMPKQILGVGFGVLTLILLG